MSKQANNGKVGLEALISNGFDMLISVIDAAATLSMTASDACIFELRRKLELLEVDAEAYASLLEDVPGFLAFEKRAKEYNAERMVQFGKFISLPENVMHAAALNFKRSADGSRSTCDCEAFVVEDAGTIEGAKYLTRFSSTFSGLSTCFNAWAKVEPEAAYKALYLEKGAAAELRAFYDAWLEEQAEAKKDAAGSGTNASGTDTAPQLPVDAPEWLRDFWNATESLQRICRAAAAADPETASKLIPPVTAAVKDLCQKVAQSIAESVTPKQKTA